MSSQRATITWHIAQHKNTTWCMPKFACHIYNVLCWISCSCIWLVLNMHQTPHAFHSTKERILSRTSSIPIRPVKLTSVVCPNIYSTNWPVTLLYECTVSMPQLMVERSQCSVHHLQTGFVKLRPHSRYYDLDYKVLWITSLQV